MLKARLGFVVGREGFLSLQGGGKDGVGCSRAGCLRPREWNGGAGGSKKRRRKRGMRGGGGERAGFVCRRCLHKCLLFLLLPLSLLPGWLPSPHKMGGVVRPRKFFASLLCKIEWAQHFGIGCPQQMISPCAGRANFFLRALTFQEARSPWGGNLTESSGLLLSRQFKMRGSG